MKKLTLAIAVLALMSTSAVAANHTGHDSSPPMHPNMEHHKKWEASLGVGGSYSFAKDNHDARISDMGLAGGMQMMYHLNKYLAVGLDYTMMAPQAHSDSRDGGYDYSKLRVHHMDIAGKLTFAHWDKMSFYSPMGFGMSKIELKGSGAYDGVATSDSKDKWGMNFYLGLGMQYDLTDDLFVGLEYRYYMPFIKTEDLTRYGKDRYMDFHNIGLRMGMRF